MRFSFFSTILAAILLCSCSSEYSINWKKDALGKYADDPSVTELIEVKYLGGSDAEIHMFVKNAEGGKVWTETLVCSGYVGKNGIGKEKEGDAKTPVGDFGILTAFGIKPDPGTVLPYWLVDENTWCCGDELFYNQLIDISEHPHDCSNGEHLIDYVPEYNYGLFPDYNKECEVGKGSAIFFHCTGAKAYTGGCIAVSEADMITILQTVSEGARIIVGKK